ncbi:GNAT family N-acetyltransferase [Algoriphagus zhangzhouensis]|uniref:Protein N-acetyltransferase, RimJ/RimL family n=1 Tax=Algoriphagus zhangzhouensis TaxID=1073327 RepID=A0A1M7Z7D2_9BACT|nr:GNAT family N-acetyltransferase [Algoriphagus zhangzhouensis]TDY49351.1 RimJ/RimL family protein N-acetyltransferase [Algoriphagus zhangzhouensis]SHO60811.1 Protein N-acetyltransferase, RimJ/RimL family [Algoriphagus zhangzhouensis]
MFDFDFNKDYILEDERVKLSPLQIDNVSDLLEIANEPDIWNYSFIKGNGEKKLRNYIAGAINQRHNQKEYPFIVFDKQTNQYAGCTRYCEISPNIQSIRLGYTWYGERFRGTGLNKHCKYLLFQFAFEKMGAERIGLAAYSENLRSIAAMESVGCKKEGVFRGIFPSLDGKGRTDAVLLSILKPEWEKHVKHVLRGKLT